MSTISATITAEGSAPDLEGFRQRVNALLAEEGEIGFTELHTAEGLDYRFKVKRGIPFPSFVAASEEYPGVTVRVEWRSAADGTGGMATIQSGRLVSQTVGSTDPASEIGLRVEAGEDGAIILALALRPERNAWIGYVLSDADHAFAHWSTTPGEAELSVTEALEPHWIARWRIRGESVEHSAIEPPEAIPDSVLAALDRLANEFAADWVWFDESPAHDTAVERHRFAQYGFSVRPANLRSERLKRVMSKVDGGYRFDSIPESARAVADRIADLWKERAGTGRGTE